MVEKKLDLVACSMTNSPKMKKAIEEVFKKFSEMPKEEFLKRMEEAKDSEWGQILDYAFNPDKYSKLYCSKCESGAVKSKDDINYKCECGHEFKVTND